MALNFPYFWRQLHSNGTSNEEEKKEEKLYQVFRACDVHFNKRQSHLCSLLSSCFSAS